MGIKMNKVRCNGQEISINEYNSGNVHSNLKCCYCNANISFVKPYEKDLGERKIIVQKYFRLKSGEEHEQGCRYTVDGAISNIYAACADDTLMSKQDNGYVVRLMFVSQHAIENEKERKNFSDNSGHGKRQQNYIPSGKKEAYLSTINQILKLRASVESNSDLESKINLKYFCLDGKPYFVLWKNFYFDSQNDNDYSRLLKYLIDRKIYHPLCVAGHIKSISEYRPGKFCVQLEHVSDERNSRIAIEIYFEDNQIYEEIKGKENYKIIVYAEFQSSQKKAWVAPNGRKIIYYNIKGNIYDNRQILILHDETIL